MSEATRCPDEAALWRFFDGDGTEEELAEIGRHQEGCVECRELLAKFVGTDSWGTIEEEDQGTDGDAASEVAFLAAAGYEVVGKLGQGGMGVVYRARHRKLKRDVAVKMLLWATPSREHLARFRTEAEAIARLQHPNIVQIYDIGECDGTPFFTLEYCPHGSLKKKLGGAPLPSRDAAELVRQVALGVQAAHDARVVHRDLKPANVLLAADGTPKVADFGLAKKLDEAGQTQSGGSPMGTPSYMAPEQAEGGKDVGPLADVWALGAVLYECLTGRPPFLGPSVLSTLKLVRTQDPVSPRQLNTKVPRDLETICLACLRKEPVRRYGTAAEVAADLRRFLAGESIAARRPSWGERVAKWVRRRPAFTTLMATVGMAAVVALGLGYWSWVSQVRRKYAEIDRQVSRFNSGERLAFDAETAREVLHVLADAEANGLLLTAQMRLSLARALMVVNRRTDALQELQRLDRGALTPESRAIADVAEGVLWIGVSPETFRSKLQAALARPELPIAERYYAKGMLATTLEEAQRSFEEAARVNVWHIEARAMLASCHLLLGRIPECKELAKASLGLAPDHPHFPAVLALAAAFEEDRIDAFDLALEIQPLLEKPKPTRLAHYINGIDAPMLFVLIQHPDLFAVLARGIMEELALVSQDPPSERPTPNYTLPPAIQEGYHSCIDDVLRDKEPSPGIALIEEVFPGAAHWPLLTATDTKRATSAHKDRSIKVLQIATSHFEVVSRKIGGGEGFSDTFRDSWAEAGAAFESAASAPGIIHHQARASIIAAVLFYGAGKPSHDHPGRQLLVEKALRIIDSHRSRGLPLSPSASYYVLEMLVWSQRRTQALSLLQEWDTHPRLDKGWQYHKQRAVFLHRLGQNEQCLQVLAMIPTRVRLTATERAELAALRRSAEARLKERFGEEGRP